MSYTITHDDTDYGTFSAGSPTEALLCALKNADRTRSYEVDHISDSPNYGMGSLATNGNGAQDRSRYFYVTDGCQTSVFVAKEILLE